MSFQSGANELPLQTPRDVCTVVYSVVVFLVARIYFEEAVDSWCECWEQADTSEHYPPYMNHVVKSRSTYSRLTKKQYLASIVLGESLDHCTSVLLIWFESHTAGDPSVALSSLSYDGCSTDLRDK